MGYGKSAGGSPMVLGRARVRNCAEIQDTATKSTAESIETKNVQRNNRFMRPFLSDLP
jgi:hypothetical protein